MLCICPHRHLKSQECPTASGHNERDYERGLLQAAGLASSGSRRRGFTDGSRMGIGKLGHSGTFEA